jgi:uncharacterized protein YndB with AHSA1/START domain
MEIDIAKHIGAVSREVASRDVEGRPARVVVATRTYDTTADDVWDAITNAERIPRWFLPISGDLRLGGRYQLQGNAGGEITQCEPPRHLAVTWEFGGNVSWVTVRLADDPNGGTRLELEHVAHVPDEMWNQYGPGAVGVGWDMALVGLAEHIATGAAIDRQAAEAWPTSENGKQFVTRASDDWSRASIAAGTDETAAKGAAKRTTAFYTGTEPPTES